LDLDKISATKKGGWAGHGKWGKIAVFFLLNYCLNVDSNLLIDYFDSKHLKKISNNLQINNGQQKYGIRNNLL
jgi:hypothetical protein